MPKILRGTELREFTIPTQAKTKAKCPHCRASYRVPEGAIGRKARCTHCKSFFKIGQNRSPRPAQGPPTDEDVLRWLNEGMDDEISARPRMEGEPVTDGPATVTCSRPAEKKVQRKKSMPDVLTEQAEQAVGDGQPVVLPFHRTG